MTSEHLNKYTHPLYGSIAFAHRRVASPPQTLPNSVGSGGSSQRSQSDMAPQLLRLFASTGSGTNTNRHKRAARTGSVGFLPAARTARNAAPSTAPTPTPLQYSNITAKAMEAPLNATGIGRALNAGLNQIIALFALYFTPDAVRIRQDVNHPRLIGIVCNKLKNCGRSDIATTIDGYLAKVQNRPHATFSKGWVALAESRALAAITDLTESREFKELPIAKQLEVTQELMKYSIKYCDNNTVQIVKLSTIEQANAFNKTVISALTRSKLEVKSTRENQLKVRAIFDAAIDELNNNTGPEPAAGTRHPLMAANYIPGHIVTDIVDDIFNHKRPSTPPKSNARQANYRVPTDSAETKTILAQATRSLTPVQKREVLVRIVLDLIASNYEFDPKNRIELGIASLATRLDLATSTYLSLSKFQAWANSKSKNTPESSLISPKDVLRFLYTLDTHEAEGCSITAKDIVQRVFPAIGDLTSPVTYLVRRFPLIFNTDPKTGTSLGEPVITDSAPMHDGGAPVSSISHQYSEVAVQDIDIDIAPLTKSTRWSDLRFQDAAIFDEFRNAVHGHSEEEYDVLTLPTYGLGQGLLTAVQNLDWNTLTQFVNDILPTDTEPGQESGTRSRAELLIDHLFPGSVTPSDVDLDGIVLRSRSSSSEYKESEDGDSPSRVIPRPLPRIRYHTGTAVPVVNVLLQGFLDRHADALSALEMPTSRLISLFGQTIVDFQSDIRDESTLHSDFVIDSGLAAYCFIQCTDPTYRTQYVRFIRSTIQDQHRAELLIQRLLYHATFASPVDRHGVVYVRNADGSSPDDIGNTAHFGPQVSIEIDGPTGPETMIFHRLPTENDGSCALHSLFADPTTAADLRHSTLAVANAATYRGQICGELSIETTYTTTISDRLLQEAAGTVDGTRADHIAAICNTFNTTRRANDGSARQPNGQFEVGEVKLMAQMSGDNVWILHPVTSGNVETMVLWKSKPDSDALPPFVVVHTGGAHYERWNTVSGV